MDHSTTYLSMFLLGLFGTGHCLGMCGPLVVALPGRFGRWHAHLIYHGGRIATYTLVGFVLSAIGRGLALLAGAGSDAALLWTSRVQIAVSIPVAGFLLFMGLTRFGLVREPAWMARALPGRIPGYGTVLSHVLNRSSAVWLFTMGLLLGLLPCGLSYGAFARALAAQHLLEGGLMVLLFGLGTLPGLLILGTGAARIFQRYRGQMEIISGLIMIGMGVALIADVWSAVV